jgi:hypothetical protein
MKKRIALGAATVLIAGLSGPANAQVDGQKELEICKTFCVATEKQCERDLLVPGIAGLAAIVALGQLNPRYSNENDNGSGSKLPQGSKSANSNHNDQVVQRCEADRVQCANDCAQPAPNSEANK